MQWPTPQSPLAGHPPAFAVVFGDDDLSPVTVYSRARGSQGTGWRAPPIPPVHMVRHSPAGLPVFRERCLYIPSFPVVSSGGPYIYAFISAGVNVPLRANATARMRLFFRTPLTFRHLEPLPSATKTPLLVPYNDAWPSLNPEALWQRMSFFSWRYVLKMLAAMSFPRR